MRISLHILWHDASHVLGGVFLTPTFIILHTLIHILYQCLKIIFISSKIVFQSSCNRYCETYTTKYHHTCTSHWLFNLISSAHSCNWLQCQRMILNIDRVFYNFHPYEHFSTHMLHVYQRKYFIL